MADCAGFPQFGIHTCDELKNMTVATAKIIYYTNYWKFDSIRNSSVATKLFDMYVNIGPFAIKLAQRAVNTSGAILVEDGHLGPKTAAAIDSIDPDVYLQRLVSQSLLYYKHIVDHNHSQSVFLAGWNARARRLP